MSTSTLPQWFTPVKPILTRLISTGSGTFVPASTTRYLHVTVVGGGGGGGGGNNDSGGYGGGGGATWTGYIDTAASINYSIGTGGSGGTSNSSAASTTSGNAGGASWIISSTTIQAGGGAGGASTITDTFEPAAGGTVTQGPTLGIAISGDFGGVPIENGTVKYSGAGGSSSVSGHRGARYNLISTNSTAYGVGGSGGTATLVNGQAGIQGVIIIYEYAY